MHSTRRSKHLTLSHALLLVVFGRYVAGTLFALLIWWWQGRPPFTREMLRGHLLRGVLIAATASLFFFAITRLTLAEAITLSFTAPLMIPPLAQLFLGERMRGPVLAAGLLGVRRCAGHGAGRAVVLGRARTGARGHPDGVADLRAGGDRDALARRRGRVDQADPERRPHPDAGARPVRV